MGRAFNPPQILDTENGQGQNPSEQPYMIMESSYLVHPGENTNINGGTFPSPWTIAPRSRITSSSSIPNAEMPCFQQQAPGPSQDPSLHQPAGGSFHTVPNSYSCALSSSSLSGQTVPEAHGSFVNQTPMSSGRGPYKRKIPSTPQLYDMGSTSRYSDAGSSSNLLLPADPWQGKQNTVSYHMPWGYSPGYRVNSLFIRGEGMQRNVRSRTLVHQVPHLSSTNLPNNYLHRTFSHQPSDRSNLMNYSGQNSKTPTMGWNHCLTSPAGLGGTRGADSSSFDQLPNLSALNSCAYNSVESGGYSNIATMPQHNCSYLNESRREVQSSYDRRPAPAFSTSSSRFYPGQVASSCEGPAMAAESFPSRHSQAFSTIRLRYNERNVRRGISNNRNRSFAESSAPDRVVPQDITANYSTYYGSNTLFDQHRDMTLDVDNMSYEELLALGERIGSVSTGLSDDLVSKCLVQSIYCSSDQSPDVRTCVICLEEYKQMDAVGALKCGHDFHVDCIRKWLSMKNLCPVCKASAVDDSMKEELSA